MKIKLFTHSDLDGVGCAILMKNVYRNDKIDIEYCDYGNVNDKIKEFLNSVVPDETYFLYRLKNSKY